MEVKVKIFRQIEFQFKLYKKKHPPEKMENESLSKQMCNQLKYLQNSKIKELMCDVSGLVEKVLYSS